MRKTNCETSVLAASAGESNGKRGSIFHPAERPPGSWQPLAATLFRERMLDSERLFPCVFGVDTSAQRKVTRAAITITGAPTHTGRAVADLPTAAH